MRRAITQFGWVVIVLVAAVAWSQGVPRLTGVDPATGHVGDSLTIIGENLGNGSVETFLLSDDQKDYPAVVVEQTSDRVVIRVPDVQPGGYNISLQVENNIFIQPVRFTVE